MRRRLEARIRRAWLGGRPPLALRAAGRAFAACRDGRNALYDRAWLPIRRAGLPIVSVGGVTVGGSAKTPLTSEIADWLTAAGHRVAILTRGYADELDLHRRRRPDALVLGDRDRLSIARRAASEGATVALLDDGLQHRRLARDLELVALDRDALRRTSGAPLPAGPFRERWQDALGRAHAVVLTGREAWSDELRSYDERLREEIRRLHPGIRAASLKLEPDAPRAANEAARATGEPPRPTVALTGIMKPNLFFDQARAYCPTLRVEVALPDHGVPSAAELDGLLAAAGEGGVLTTEKDLSRLEALLAGTPLWVLPERLTWIEGEEELRHFLLSALPIEKTG